VSEFVNVVLWVVVVPGVVAVLMNVLSGRRDRVEQRLYIWCECGNELVGSSSFVSDTYEDDGNHVRYLCTSCGARSDYDFDICMSPIRRSYEPGEE
jgi:hypothetical protein